jgi:hypothetical protein
MAAVMDTCGYMEWDILTKYKEKQAGAELCQAQVQHALPDEAELTFSVLIQNWALLEEAYCQG